MTKEKLIELINDYLKALGYKKKDKTWYKENAETITIFALEKSRFGDIYYVSLCVNFKALNPEKYPKFYKSHSRIRVGHLGEKTEEYLNLEKSMNKSIRKEKIKYLLDKSISILSRMETVSEFKKLLKQFNPRFFWLKQDVQKFLSIKVE